ncbi:hypothetical protein CspHIS471_0301710 [Cutaneotrichosporon sp. HIS471]|nr:hypothetical protein CspHIS471_0301710 [Cutaneotrichosporon sp. HIS471]
MAMRSIQRFSANEYTPLIRDQMPATRRMVARSPSSPIYSPNESDVTIRASDHHSSTPSTPRVRIIPPTPLEEPAGLPDEPHYPYEPEEEEVRGGGWWSAVVGWAGLACFLPIKLCVYASRASRSETVASRVA